MRTPLLLSLLFAAGCAADTDSDQQLSEHGQGSGSDEACGACKIEGPSIGEDGTFVHVDGERIVFESWTPKAGSPDEFVGFTLSPNAAGLSYLVKAGTEVFVGSGTSWSHPAGDSGPAAHGISNVDLCPPDDEEPLPDID